MSEPHPLSPHRAPYCPPPQLYRHLYTMYNSRRPTSPMEDFPSPLAMQNVASIVLKGLFVTFFKFISFLSHNNELRNY